LRAFIDTSSLIKKYVLEKGSDILDSVLESVTEITVSPTYWMEVHSTISRRLKEKTISRAQGFQILHEAQKDLHYFHKILWNERLEEKTIELIEEYDLKTLDGLQLASAVLSNTDLFLTSDKALFKRAAKKLKNTRFI
jgi:predicted nucleic acid-binding protein